MVQIVHRNYPFAICFNLAYFVSCCNDNRIRLQEICWSTVLWYLPSVYGWLKIKYLSTLKYHVFPVMFQIQSCNQKVRKMPSKYPMCAAYLEQKDCHVVCSCRKLLFSSLWSTCPVNPANRLKHVRNISWYLVMLPVEKTRGQEASTRYY